MCRSFCGSLLLLLAGCGPSLTVVWSDPSPIVFGCPDLDGSARPLDPDAVATAGFSAADLADLVDGSHTVTATWDGDDLLVLEPTITLALTSDPQRALDIERPASGAQQHGPVPPGICPVGPLIRLPVTAHWTLTTVDTTPLEWRFETWVEATALSEESVWILNQEVLAAEDLSPDVGAAMEAAFERWPWAQDHDAEFEQGETRFSGAMDVGAVRLTATSGDRSRTLALGRWRREE